MAHQVLELSHRRARSVRISCEAKLCSGFIFFQTANYALRAPDWNHDIVRAMEDPDRRRVEPPHDLLIAVEMRAKVPANHHYGRKQALLRGGIFPAAITAH
eukprot:CAMPEP_0184494980 /NCGR_PEP_ID=MMETSP0113_2-20130426/30065_1 /TAXON_ID=91329 /ORGANISM="Norrisiella sphaerica, Strain BC52" /LENGTH=100 /DNA_ID=CAMNT_0026880953 /DNA_START=129 /DNA_END=431 /DNA_ORIENTATION=+